MSIPIVNSQKYKFYCSKVSTLENLMSTPIISSQMFNNFNTRCRPMKYQVSTPDKNPNLSIWLQYSRYNLNRLNIGINNNPKTKLQQRNHPFMIFIMNQVFYFKFNTQNNTSMGYILAININPK